MIEDDPTRPVRFRLSWRWKESGVAGSTPWTRRSDTVTGWMESLARRSGERVEHWIEVSHEDVELSAVRSGRPSRDTDRASTRS